MQKETRLGGTCPLAGPKRRLMLDPVGIDRAQESADGDLRRLIDACRDGQADAFGRLFETFRQHLLFLAKQELPPGLRGKLGASDLVQETAFDAQSDFRAFRGSTPEECLAWLRAILRNNLIDAVRRYKTAQKRAARVEFSLDTPQGRREGENLAMSWGISDNSAMRREDASILACTIVRLSPDHQEVLRMRHWEGLSFIEIGNRLDRSPDAARKLWYRALDRLQDELQGNSVGKATPGSG